MGCAPQDCQLMQLCWSFPRTEWRLWRESAAAENKTIVLTVIDGLDGAHIIAKQVASWCGFDRQKIKIGGHKSGSGVQTTFSAE
jgi:hypothetical protein